MQPPGPVPEVTSRPTARWWTAAGFRREQDPDPTTTWKAPPGGTHRRGSSPAKVGPLH